MAGLCPAILFLITQSILSSPGLSRRSRSGTHNTRLSGMAGTSPAMTVEQVAPSAPTFRFDFQTATSLLLMVRSAAKPRVSNHEARAFILRDAAQDAAPQDEDRPRQASPPLLFEARGRLHSSPPSRGRHFPHPKTRGMARRWAQPSFQCAIPFGTAAPAGAPSRRSPSGAGPRFLPGIPARTVSELLAGVRSDPGRCPGAARVRGCEPRPRAPHPAPLSRRLMRAPSADRTPSG